MPGGTLGSSAGHRRFLFISCAPRSAPLDCLQSTQREPDRDGDFTWGTTLKGGQLINASAMKPITRASAEKAVAAFLGRCDELDIDPYWLYRVKRVRVFGSYITDKERLGPINTASASWPTSSTSRIAKTRWPCASDPSSASC